MKTEDSMEGKIELITGPMFAGKTCELIRRVRRARIAKRTTILFKHSMDDRYGQCCVSTHDRDITDAIPIDSSVGIEGLSEEFDIIAIDEAQFFDDKIVSLANKLADLGKRVILAGINQDSDGNSFRIMEQLLGAADEVLHLTAICTECGNKATKTLRLEKKTERFVTGGTDLYVSLCRSCFNNARSE